MFPFLDRGGHVAGEIGDQVEMIGHDEGKMDPPFFLSVIEADGFEDFCGPVVAEKWSVVTVLDAEGEEEGFLFGVADPRRDFVGEAVAAQVVHGFLWPVIPRRIIGRQGIGLPAYSNHFTQ
jgi:hypothetical protein